jgi:hypothetical protein
LTPWRCGPRAGRRSDPKLGVEEYSAGPPTDLHRPRIHTASAARSCSPWKDLPADRKARARGGKLYRLSPRLLEGRKKWQTCWCVPAGPPNE